jgi:hypothetical protein
MAARVCRACGGPRRGGKRATIVGEGWRGRGMVCRLCAQGGTLICVLIKRRKKKKTPRRLLEGDLGTTFGIEMVGKP